MGKLLNVFWLYFHDLQNKRDSVTDLKDNSSKGRRNSMTSLGKASHDADLTFHSTPFSEAPSVYKDHTLKKPKEKRVRNKHKYTKQGVHSGRILESLFR